MYSIENVWQQMFVDFSQSMYSILITNPFLLAIIIVTCTTLIYQYTNISDERKFIYTIIVVTQWLLLYTKITESCMKSLYTDNAAMRDFATIRGTIHSDDNIGEKIDKL